MVRYSNFFLHSFGNYNLLLSFNRILLDNLHKFLLIHWHFHHTHSFIKPNHFFDNFGLHWVGFLDCYWNLYGSCCCILIGNLFAVGHALL
jgi:hypothetical protein